MSELIGAIDKYYSDRLSVFMWVKGGQLSNVSGVAATAELIDDPWS